MKSFVEKGIPRQEHGYMHQNGKEPLPRNDYRDLSWKARLASAYGMTSYGNLRVLCEMSIYREIEDVFMESVCISSDYAFGCIACEKKTISKEGSQSNKALMIYLGLKGQ